MDCYEILVSRADQLGLEVIEKEFKSSAKGLCKGKKIGISKSLDTVEKRCVLAEEMAHSFYTVGDILDTRDPAAYKQEMLARSAAFEYLIPLGSLVEAYMSCQYDLSEIPNYLEVTWEFLRDTLSHYSRKYGGMRRYEKYVIYFSPLIVCEHSHTCAG